MTRPCAISRIVWRGVAIEVRHCADWSPSFREIYGHPLAHLEIEAVDPARVPLPVTETGYRSLFTASAVIEARMRSCWHGWATKPSSRNGKSASRPRGR